MNRKLSAALEIASGAPHGRVSRTDMVNALATLADEVMKHRAWKLIAHFPPPYGVEVWLWRKGTPPEIAYWPGQPRHSNKEFPPTHWMPYAPPDAPE